MHVVQAPGIRLLLGCRVRWIPDEDGRVLIYYASSDTRMHVAESSVERLVDYCKNTPADDLRTGKSVEKIIQLIIRNELKS